MFETPKEIKPEASTGLWMGIGAVVLVGALGAGAYFFVSSGGRAAKNASTAPAKAAPAKPADAAHDLKVQAATMNKDRTGTTAVWLVDIENKSADYNYSKLEYETTYVGVDNKALLINKGTINETLAPGDRKNSEIRDALYPTGTAWYKFRITGATASAQ